MSSVYSWNRKTRFVSESNCLKREAHDNRGSTVCVNNTVSIYCVLEQGAAEGLLDNHLSSFCPGIKTYLSEFLRDLQKLVNKIIVILTALKNVNKLCTI